MRRVVITGVGFVSSLGLDAKSTWRAMLSGECGVRPLRGLELPPEPVQVAAEVSLPESAPGDNGATSATDWPCWL